MLTEGGEGVLLSFDAGVVPFREVQDACCFQELQSHITSSDETTMTTHCGRPWRALILADGDRRT